MIQVGWFGKIPKYKEFVSGKMSGKLPLWLRNWVEDGHDLFVSKLPERKGDISANLRFILLDQQNDGCLAGVMTGSEDSIGRRFPITYFALFPLSMFSDLTYLPMAVAPIWRLLENTEIAELEVVKEQIEDWQKQGKLEILPANRRHIEELIDNLTMEEFLNLCGVYPYENFEKLRVLRSFEKRGEGLPPVCIKGRLPAEKTLFFLCLWYLIIKKLFRSTIMPHCFVSGFGDTGTEFTFFFRWPLKLDFLNLLGIETQTEYTLDLTKNARFSFGQGAGRVSGRNLNITFKNFLATMDRE